MPAFIDDLRAALPDHVTVTSPLTAGGQGAVFLGTWRGSLAAIKAFSMQTDGRRIDRECRLLAGLNCPYLVRLYEQFPVVVGADQIRIVAYEFHSGGDLSANLQPGASPLIEAELLKVGLQIGAAIETLWSSRIVHRDIKPANIVRASDGNYVLVDVGFARHLDLSDITAFGGSPGTRGFRSPEQAKGRRSLTVHSDVYSLGVTLYLLSTNQHPTGCVDITAPTQINMNLFSARSLSPGFSRLVQQMLEFVPAQRPSNLVARFSAIGAQ